MILYHSNAVARRLSSGCAGYSNEPGDLRWCRNHFSTQEFIRESVTPEMLERNNGRFAMLCGQYLFNGWREQGPDFGRDPARVAALGKAQFDPRFG